MNGPPRKNGKLIPCGSCPWRRSTKTAQIPGGGMDHLASGDCLDGGKIVMACHLSTDEAPVACVGFVQAQKGADDFRSLGLRLAVALKYLDPEDFSDGGADLYPTMREMLAAHPADGSG